MEMRAIWKTPGLSVAALVSGLGAGCGLAGAEPAYPWQTAARARTAPAGADVTIAARFKPPAGFRRVTARPGSFAHWLRHLPLRPRGTPVRLHNGRLKVNQFVHAAVVDIDIGRRDLQQCADAVIRLRAEYLYARRRFGAIRFHFTSGDLARFDRWAAGWRPRIRGSRVSWVRRRATGTGRASFRRYLNLVFTYAGTISVRREMARVPGGKVRIGDVFVQAGSPGHAVLVVDMVENPRTGERRFLLVQSYMPAQSVHVLRNPATGGRSPWFSVRMGARLETPEWRFRPGDLRRFRGG